MKQLINSNFKINKESKKHFLMHNFDSPEKSVPFDENNLDIENSAVSQNMKQPVNLDESLTNTIQSQKTAKSMQIIEDSHGQ